MHLGRSIQGPWRPNLFGYYPRFQLEKARDLKPVRVQEIQIEQK
jgi:hypothetical protein